MSVNIVHCSQKYLTWLFRFLLLLLFACWFRDDFEKSIFFLYFVVRQISLSGNVNFLPLAINEENKKAWV